jgi:hypothetical protein
MMCCSFRSRAVVPTLPGASLVALAMRLKGFSDFRSDRRAVCWLAWNIPFYLGNEILGMLDRLSIGQTGRFIQWLDVGV